MSDALAESGMRARRPAPIQALSYSANKKYFGDRDTMRELVHESWIFIPPSPSKACWLWNMTVIQDRRANQTETKDLLNTMLNGVDKQTGAKLSDKNIGYNVCSILRRFLTDLWHNNPQLNTFLIAGMFRDPCLSNSLALITLKFCRTWDYIGYEVWCH